MSKRQEGSYYPNPEEIEAEGPKVWTLQNITRDERDYLNQLSQKLYRTKSKWQKMLKGEKAPMEEILPDGSPRKYVGIHYQTLAEVKNLMEELMKEEDELRAKQEAEALEQKATREQQKADDDQAGYEKQASEEKPHDPVMDVLETVGD